jgi:CubicO group peptidase (beta-lactamase class C family)
MITGRWALDMAQQVLDWGLKVVLNMGAWARDMAAWGQLLLQKLNSLAGWDLCMVEQERH